MVSNQMGQKTFYVYNEEEELNTTKNDGSRELLVKKMANIFVFWKDH